jgi:antitoxin component of RelBE/YafQ-DinJ toxin-antitoxin module
MRKSYDFSSAVRNPYAKRLKRQLTIRLDEETIRYFQELSREMSLPYQTLMNMYLRDCAETQKRPHWTEPTRSVRAKKVAQRTAASGRRRRPVSSSARG